MSKPRLLRLELRLAKRGCVLEDFQKLGARGTPLLGYLSPGPPSSLKCKGVWPCLLMSWQSVCSLQRALGAPFPGFTRDCAFGV